MRLVFLIFLVGLSIVSCSSQSTELLKALTTAKEDTSKARLLRTLGWKYLVIDQDSSLMFYEQSYTLSKKLKDTRGEILGLLNISSAHCRRGDTDPCLKLLREAKTLALISTDPDMITTCYGRMAQYYSNDVYRPDSALLYFSLAEEYYKKSGDAYHQWMLYLYRGELYFVLGKYDRAEEDLLHALELTAEKGSRIDHGIVLHRLVRNYFDLQDWEKYSKYVEDYLKFLNDTEDRGTIDNSAHRVLYFFEDNADPVTSIPILEKIQQAHEKRQNWSSAIDALKFLSDLRVKTGDTEGAITGLQRAAALASTYGYVLEQEATYYKLYELYESTRNTAKALEYFKKYKAVQDSVEILDNKKLIDELEIRYATQKKDEQLVLQRVELERQQLAQRNLILLACLLVLLALATLVFLYSKYKANLVLKEKKATIEKALQEKELLLREIHHRVKNNLQVISSLLNLQSRYISDEKAVEAIKDGRNRVNSMSLIHQDLYLNENLTTIDLGLYLEKLSDSLFQSYNIDPARIRLDTRVQQAKLDVDTLIPLGLILNELLSNALKHAFPGERTGEVKVRFQDSGEHYFLEVKDDGIGMSGRSLENLHESFGIEMIKAFAHKLKASLEFKTMNGVTASLLIPKTPTSSS